jgi:hypothetical protein
MRDEWTKKLPDDRTVIYTSEFVPGNGGVIIMYLDEIARTHIVEAPLTREEVEVHFTKP